MLLLLLLFHVELILETTEVELFLSDAQDYVTLSICLLKC